MSNPIREPDRLDYVVLAGRRSPGVVEITGADSPRTWDKRRGVGLTGARIIFRGVDLAEPRLRFTFYTAEQLDEWESFRSVLAPPPPGERARHLAIEHPILADNGITAVAIKRVGQLVQSGHGVWSIDVDTLQYRELTPALSAPKGADGGSQLTANQREIIQQGQELEALGREARSLMGAGQ